MAPDGKTPLKTILELAKDKGMATGLVTTSGITDATPAAFAAHVPHRSDEASVAAQELQLGVDVLMGGRKLFFLPEAQGGKRKDGRMIEGGRIDHAAHRNDAAATIRDTLAFDEAVGVALDFQRRNPDTLLIVTADHETGGMALIGHSKDSKEYVGIDLSAIQKAQTSMELIVDELGKTPTPEKVREAVKRHLAIQITEDEAKLVADDTI
ncbi:MAG: alkaline phosphatase, partial [candidate division NC10 bacterium]|nr:alkaline phosphatase [candidate division NC10 bacterium]